MRKELLAVALLLVIASVAAADDLQTLEQALQAKGITRTDIDIRNCVGGSDVFNPARQNWDSGKRVCEVWTKERVTRIEAKPVYFADNSAPLLTTEVGKQEPVQKTEYVTKTTEYAVKQIAKTETKTLEKKQLEYVPSR